MQNQIPDLQDIIKGQFAPLKIDPIILETIPQKPPFLFIEKIIEKSQEKVITTLELSGDEYFFKGHFPGRAVMPGVLMTEGLLQSGAFLLAQQTGEDEIGVVSRIEKVKFKNLAGPGDLLTYQVDLKERLGNAFFMKGKVKVENKLILTAEFACTAIPNSPIQ